MLSESDRAAESAYVKKREPIDREREEIASERRRIAFEAEAKAKEEARKAIREKEREKLNDDSECVECGALALEVSGTIVEDDDVNPTFLCDDCKELDDNTAMHMSDARDRAKRIGQPWDKKEWIKNHPPETLSRFLSRDRSRDPPDLEAPAE